MAGGDSVWSARIHIGGLPLGVAVPGAGPAGWPSGAVAQLTACVAAPAEGPPAAGRVVLAPEADYERAYRTAAAALAADDTVCLLSHDDGGEYRLRSLGEALVVEWGTAASIEDARGFSEAELAGALLMLRAVPRRLPVRAAGARSFTDPAPVLDLLQARRARGL